MEATRATTNQSFNDEINEIWKQVEDRVIEMAGGDRSSINSNLGIESVLDYLDRAQASNKKAAEKFSTIRNIFKRSLQCIQTVGGIVATGASYAFAPAGTCYSALTFVIQAWQGYEGIFESLASLLEKCTEFLDRLGYYAQFGMDPKLTKVACQHLKIFVEICDRSLNLKKKRNKLTAFVKQLFLNDDGVQDLLGAMQRLMDKERGLVAAQTWRSSNEAAQNSKDGLALARKLHNSLVEDGNQVRLEREIKKWKICVVDAMENDAAIITDTDIKPPWEKTWMRHKSNIIDGSGKWLFQDPRFKSWLANSESNSPILGLQGGDGTGKTLLVSNIVLHLRKMNSVSSDSRVIVVHNLLDNNSKSTTNEAYMLEITRSIVCQMALSDPSFLKYAAAICDREKYFENSLEIWRQMLFENDDLRNINATFFIIFDGVGQDVQAFLDLFKRLTSGPIAPQIRILLAAEKEVFNSIEKTKTLTLNKFVLGDANVQDIELYIKHRMDNMDMLKDEARPGIPEMRENILNGLRHSTGGDYYKLGSVLDSISKTDDIDEIISYLETAGRARLEQIGADIEKMNMTRTSKELAEVNEMILWLNTSFMRMEPCEMEAALALKGSSASLMSLESKIKTKYSIFQIDYQNWVGYKLEAVPEKIPMKSLGTIQGSNPAGNGEIQSGEINMLKHYLSIVCPQELYERVGFSEFLDMKLAGRKSYIFQDPENAHMELVLRCLKCLTEPRTRRTEALYEYSRNFLFEHMQKVDLSMTDRSLKAEAGEQLVKLFTDPYAIVSLLDFRDDAPGILDQFAEDNKFSIQSSSDEAWNYNDKGLLLLGTWFRDTAIVVNVKNHPMVVSFNDPGANKFSVLFEIGMKESARILFQVGREDHGRMNAFTFLCTMIIRIKFSSGDESESSDNVRSIWDSFVPDYELFQAVEEWSQTVLGGGENDATWELHAAEILLQFAAAGNIPLSKAEERARRVLELDPGSWKALRILSQAVDSASESTKILLRLVENLMADDEFRGSSENLAHLIKMMFHLGKNLFHKLDRKDEAIQLYSTVLDLDRSYSTTKKFLPILGDYMRDKRGDSIVEFLEKLLLEPEGSNHAGEFVAGQSWDEEWVEDLNFPMILSYSLLSANRPDLCDALFSKAITACSDDHLPHLRVTQGLVLQELGRLEEARQTWELGLVGVSDDERVTATEYLIPLWEKLASAKDVAPTEAAMLHRKIKEFYIDLEDKIINHSGYATTFGQYFYRIGDRTRAKKALIVETLRALEMLADNDTENDDTAFLILKGVFSVLHDIPNLIVNCELEYQGRRAKLEKFTRRKAIWDQRQQALGKENRSAHVSETDEGHGQVGSGAKNDSVLQGELGRDEEDLESEPVDETACSVLCSGNPSHQFRSDYGLWHCLTDAWGARFDDPCYQKLLDGTLYDEKCNKDHEFIRMPKRDDAMLDALPQGHVMLGEVPLSIDQWKEEITLKYVNFE